jgi:hypothetical protein
VGFISGRETPARMRQEFTRALRVLTNFAGPTIEGSDTHFCNSGNRGDLSSLEASQMASLPRSLQPLNREGSLEKFEGSDECPSMFDTCLPVVMSRTCPRAELVP